MCGRYGFSLKKDLAKILALDDTLDELLKENDVGFINWDIKPTTVNPVLLSNKPKHLALARWGLIPSWTKDVKKLPLMINARSETLHEKPSFKNLLKNKRAVIPASCYYEWQKIGKKSGPKFKYTVKDADYLFFAGLWDTWNDGEKDVVSYTIITIEPNELCAEVHDRMPMILPLDNIDEWLLADQSKAVELLKTYPSEGMLVEAA